MKYLQVYTLSSRQEEGYFSFTVDVEADSGEIIKCRTYQIIDLPEACDIEEHLPSMSYLKTMVKGALESELPEEYIRYLRNIKHNGNLVRHREDALHLHDFKL